MLFPIISVLRTACSSTRSYIPRTDKRQSSWEMAHKERKWNTLDPLKLNVPLTIRVGSSSVGLISYWIFRGRDTRAHCIIGSFPVPSTISRLIPLWTNLNNLSFKNEICLWPSNMVNAGKNSLCSLKECVFCSCLAFYLCFSQICLSCHLIWLCVCVYTHALNSCLTFWPHGL